MKNNNNNNHPHDLHYHDLHQYAPYNYNYNHNHSKKKNVSFRPFVEIIMIPPVDRTTKHLLYYSRSELMQIGQEAKQQIRLYRAWMAQHYHDDRQSNGDTNKYCHPNDDGTKQEQPVRKRLRWTDDSFHPSGTNTITTLPPPTTFLPSKEQHYQQQHSNNVTISPDTAYTYHDDDCYHDAGPVLSFSSIQVST